MLNINENGSGVTGVIDKGAKSPYEKIGILKSDASLWEISI